MQKILFICHVNNNKRHETVGKRQIQNQKMLDSLILFWNYFKERN